MSSFFLIHFFLAFLVGGSQGLECYNCDNHHQATDFAIRYPDFKMAECDKDLGELTDKAFFSRGSDKANLCYTLEGTFDEDVPEFGIKKGDRMLKRAGSAGGIAPDSIDGCRPFPTSGRPGYGGKKIKGNYCVCTTDKCNSGQRSTPLKITILLALIIPYLLSQIGS